MAGSASLKLRCRVGRVSRSTLVQLPVQVAGNRPPRLQPQLRPHARTRRSEPVYSSCAMLYRAVSESVGAYAASPFIRVLRLIMISWSG